MKAGLELKEDAVAPGGEWKAGCHWGYMGSGALLQRVHELVKPIIVALGGKTIKALYVVLQWA